MSHQRSSKKHLQFSLRFPQFQASEVQKKKHYSFRFGFRSRFDFWPKIQTVFEHNLDIFISKNEDRSAYLFTKLHEITRLQRSKRLN